MGGILQTFPEQNFSLIAVILLMPLLGAFVNGVWGRGLGKEAVRLMALSAVGISFLAAVVTFVGLDAAIGKEHEHVKLYWTAWEWMHTNGGRGASNVAIDLRFSVDALSGVMMLIVTGVGFLIHLYASSYMAEDKAYWRFFTYLNLFIFSMLVLILGDNLPVLFIGWEGVGLCSYLLIGFWYGDINNAAAGKKAFIANRVGDFGLICAMFLLAHYTGALDWVGIKSGASTLMENPSDAYQIHVWPIGGGTYTGIFRFLQPSHPFTISAATAVGLMLLLGCTGKSAQIPLYVWLPDAMAGPTPVSALIHAATMVTAGVYLICRLSFVFVLSPFVMMVIALVGLFTALLAATIALVQNDIKKVLAYSTVSQLGFMFMGVGVGAFTAGFFHVFTHAFFKACLFLGAGSVIHAMHARIHDDAKAQDMRNMGGLKKYMPYTYWTFVAATFAIAGCPLLSGFFSKDEILYRAFVNHSVNPFAERLLAKHIDVYVPPAWLGPLVYFGGLAAAAMTAFYMFRCLFLTFHGDFRGWTLGRPSMVSAPAHEEHDHDDAHGDDEDAHHHEEDLKQPGRAPHESPWQMTVPLIVLAAFSVLAGWLNAAPIVGKDKLALDHWLEPVFEESLKEAILPRPDAESLEWKLAVGGILVFALGAGLAYWMYIKEKGAPAKDMAERFPILHRLLLDKWRVDELYEVTVLAAVDALADTAAAFDQWFVDGIIAKLTALVVAALGTALRTLQNGVVHMYAAAMVVGLAFVSWFFVAPHPDATIVESSNGDYQIAAGPGMGYSYRWDADGNGQWDKSDAPPAANESDAQKKAREEGFSDVSSKKVHLEAGKSQVVRLEVMNAFGMRKTKDFTVSRPAPPTVLEVGQN